MGKAVVSTRVGAEGLEFVDGKEILIADDPASFAEAVAKLLRDPQERKIMGRLARSKVVERYSSKAVDQSLVTALGSLDLEHLDTHSQLYRRIGTEWVPVKLSLFTKMPSER